MNIKEQLHRQQEKEFDLSFSQWMDYFSKEPTSGELNEIEREVHKKQAQNNSYYHPLQGA